MRIIKFSSIMGVNTGDSIIAECLDYLIRKNSPNVVLVNVDILLRNKLEKHSREKKIVKSFKKWIQKFPFIRVNIKKILIYRRRETYKKLIEKNDVVIIGGGNILFGDEFLFASELISKNLSSETLCFYGIGVGPFFINHKKYLKTIKNRCEIIYTRDSYSENILRKNKFKNIQTTFDPAFLTSDVYPIATTERKYIGINLMDLNKVLKSDLQEIERIEENLATLARNLKMGIKIVVTAFNNDPEISERLYSSLLKRKIKISLEFVYNGIDVSKVFSDIYCFVSCRLHASIFALSYNIPTLIYPWQQKVKSIYSDLFGDTSNKFLLSDPNYDFLEIMEKLKLIDEEEIKILMNIVKRKIYNDFSLFTDLLKKLEYKKNA